jgi:hypothetical protein
MEGEIAIDGGEERFAVVVDSMEGVAGERRRSFVDRLRVEELHGLGRRELEKCSEGAGVFRRYSHEPLDFLAKLEEFESILVRLGLVGVGSGQLTSLAERYSVERGRKLREERKKKKNGGLQEEKRREKWKGKKEGGRKYSCLMNEGGIVIVNFEEILFILLSFLLKLRGWKVGFLGLFVKLALLTNKKLGLKSLQSVLLQEKTKSNFLQRSGVQAAPRQLRKRGQDCYNTAEKKETSR